ncbi:MAG: pyridoxamine 5'-phosphate oxidase family protein [Clostridiales bacterium]|nr:pyridoxamine 5'-phosphate oxidase family protein [Clostridiales bacterium]
MYVLRRSDRQINNFLEITDILSRATTIRLGINANPYPYVVPLSFGFEAVNEKITLYFHGAFEGYKHELIKANPMVCVEADIFYRYAQVEDSFTTEYESVIGFGKAMRITGNEALKGLNLLMGHCGFNGYTLDSCVLTYTNVYKIQLESVTGKRRLIEENAKMK